jgi:hypothetical protein
MPVARQYCSYYSEMRFVLIFEIYSQWNYFIRTFARQEDVLDTTRWICLFS